MTITDIAKLTSARPAKSGEFAVESWMRGFEDLGVVERKTHQGQTLWMVNKSALAKAKVSFSARSVSPTIWWSQERMRLALAGAIARWLYRNWWVSEKGTSWSKDGSAVTCGGRAFDVLGFSHVSGIRRERKGSIQPVPFVGDVLIRTCSTQYAEAFIQRQSDVGFAMKPRPVYFLLAKDYQQGAFRDLKNAGVLAWKRSQVFSPAMDEAVEKYLAIAESIVTARDLTPQAFEIAFSGLEDFQSLFGNLKGDLFELLVAQVFAHRGYTINLGWKISGDREAFDVDVVARRGREALIIECKGFGKGIKVPEDEADKHFKRRSPLARRLLSESPANPPDRFKFLLVSTGEGPDSYAVPPARASDTQSELWDRSRLLTELSADRRPEIASVVERYFA